MRTALDDPTTMIAGAALLAFVGGLAVLAKLVPQLLELAGWYDEPRRAPPRRARGRAGASRSGHNSGGGGAARDRSSAGTKHPTSTCTSGKKARFSQLAQSEDDDVDGVEEET